MTYAHNLKIWPEQFAAVTHPDPFRRKTVEIRQEDDKEFCVGDVLRLTEWQPLERRYTGACAVVIVTHILRGPPYLPSGYAALSIKLFQGRG
ncbi:DUF3850 domain-containing protein [Paenibacillus sanguinis]|uniref:DUF3850 domain-containing protein n=1 Tax=Paenibacillus sanguinis TaxID=225906 RepID=UPI00036C7DD8|nr:DUF3850 domain-containing protein [Paenibacillus sanguinis]